MTDGVTVDVHQANVPNGRLIYDLISANNLNRIRLVVNQLTLRHRQSIVCQTVCHKSLLGHACELGFRDIVKYLLDECEADISERYTPSEISSSPLRVSIDNLDVSTLLLLISRGAVDVDKRQARSYSYYAFNKEYFCLSSILSHYTNRMELVYSIWELPDILHWMNDMNIQANNDRFLKASASGDIHKMKTSLAAGILRKKYKGFEDNALCMAILNEQNNAEHFLLNRRVFSLKDHVLALEFCGAKFIAFQSEFDKGLRCWRKAVRIRTDEFFGESDKLDSNVHTDLASGFSSEKHLEIFENDGIELYINALIVFRRLLPPDSEVLQKAFVIVARNCVFRKDLLRAINVLGELSDFPYTSESGCIPPLKRSTTSIEYLFNVYFRSDLSSMTAFVSKFRTLMDFIHGVNWKLLLTGSREFYRFVYIHLLELLLSNMIAKKNFNLGKNDEVWITDGVIRILQYYRFPYPTTLLHLAIDDPTAMSAVPFILSCSGDANCTDDQKNTPMHIVSLLPTDDTNLPYLVKLLADAGGHIDAVNLFNMSPLSTLAAKDVLRNPLKFLSLQCLAAQTIHEFDINVPKVYPKILVSFIKLHSR